MILLKWWKGYVTCCAAGGSFERFLNICRHHGIFVHGVKQGQVLTFCVYARDYKRLLPLAHKTSVVPHIIERKGLPFWVNQVIDNWSFYTGFLLFFIFMEIMSAFVWQITFSGHQTFSKETLAKDIENMKVHTGMPRRELDCDAIEKNLREIHPEISWVSAEEIGSVLQISIKEGKNNEKDHMRTQPCHLTALYDGRVESIIVGRGTAMVKKGDHVKKGQILISGLVPVTDDGDTVVEEVPVAAEGEVVLSSQKNINEEISVWYPKKEKTGRILKKWEVRVGNYTFSLKNPLKRLDNSCKYDIMTDVCCDKVLYPVSWQLHVQTRSQVEYREHRAVYTKQELKREGIRRYQLITDSLKEKKLELTDHSAVLKKKDDKTWLLSGKISFLCHDTGKKEVDGGKNGESGSSP